MNNDNSLKYVLPALSLNYAVINDKAGRLRFFNDDVEIVYRNDIWLLINDGKSFEFESLEKALIEGAG